LQENIERVQAGLDPIHGFTRDPNQPIIDTNIDSGLEQRKADRAPEVKKGGIRELAPLGSTSADQAK